MPSDKDKPREDPDGTVLAPEELDITGDQHVVELDDGRFLISPSGDPPAETSSIDDTSLFQEASEEGSEPSEATVVDADVVYRWLRDRLGSADSRYGYDITAVFEGRVVRQELFSDDVLTTFENLLVWYAQQVGGDTPVEDVLGILLAESTVPVRLPPDAVEAITESYGLDSDDRLADLIEAIQRDGGLRFRRDAD